MAAPGNIYTCGHPVSRFRRSWFPEYEFGGPYTRNVKSNTNDIVMVGMYGMCIPGDKYISQHFQGKALYVNGEPHGNIVNEYPHFYQVGGPIADSDHTIRLYYVAFLTIPKPWPWNLDPAQRPQWSGQRSRIMYYVSHCVPHRQRAAEQLSSVVPVDTAGKCKLQSKNATAIDVAKEFPNIDTSAYGNNWEVYHHYKYCLVMENSDVSGYITEKIILAFLGGCLPIYWGTKDVFDLFHKDAFLFWDGDTILDDIQYLEANATAYYERLAAPIFANGNQTLRDFFSVTDAIGGGHLKRKIRTMLGLPNR